MPIEGASPEVEQPDLSAYDAIGKASAAAVDETPDLSAYDAIGKPPSSDEETPVAELPPPSEPQATTSDSYDFSAYDAITNKGVENSAAALKGTSSTPPSADVDLSVYDQIGPAPASQKAAAQRPPADSIILPRSGMQTDFAEARQAMQEGPVVPIPKATITQEEPTLFKAGKAAYNTVAGFAEGLESPAGTLAILNPFIGLATVGEMVPQLVQKVREAEKTPANSPERWSAAAEVTGFLALPAVIHAVGRVSGRAESPATAPEVPFAAMSGEHPAVQPETARFHGEHTVSQLVEAPKAGEVRTVHDPGIFDQLAADAAEQVAEKGRAASTTKSLDEPISPTAGGKPRPAEEGGAQTPSAPEENRFVDLMPTLRQGENQGDLLSRQTEDLRLVGEEGRDFGSEQAKAEHERLMREGEREMQDEAQRTLDEYQGQGPELLDAIESLGGLPSAASDVGREYRGELKFLRETAKGGAGAKGVFPAKLFRTTAKHPDRLVDSLREYGFDFKTPSDLFEALEMRLKTGRTHHGLLRGVKDDYALMGFGPGAASAKEPLAAYKERAFAGRFQDDKAIAQEIRDAAGNRSYEPISNKVTMENATKIVEERGIPESINMLKDEGNGLDFRVRSAMGQFIIKRLNQGYERLKGSSPSDAELLLNQTADLAEWQQEYGTRLGQGVQSFAMWQRITPEGKLLSLKRQIQRVRDKFTQENGENVRQVIDAANTGNVGALKELAKKNPIARKLKGRFQDLIDASKPQLLTEETFYQTAGEKLGIPQFSPEIARDVLKLAHEIEAAPEGMPRDAKTLELSKYIANLKGFDAKDVPLGIYYGNMLSGYNTQIVNTLDTFLNVASEINGLALTNPKAAAHIYGGLLRGFVDGKTDALLALTEGRMVSDSKWLDAPRLMEVAKFGEKGGVPIRVQGRPSAAIKFLSETKPAYVLRGWKYVTRLMAASDSVMHRAANEARSALLAYREAAKEGLTGDALSNRVNEILGLTEKATQKFEDQARDEGFTGTKFKARVSELREMSRPKEAAADSSDFAGEATYNHEPHGMLGYFADGIAKASDAYPVLKAFVPFTRIVANVTNRGLNYTPVGFKRAFYGYSREAAPTGDAQAALIARATMGTIGLATLTTLQGTGALEINGAGPTDSAKRKQLEASGWKPYSIKIGDHYYSYIYTPLGLGLSIVGNMTDSYRYNELSQKDAFTRAGYAISRVGSTIFSQSFLSGLSNLFRALSGQPGDTIASVKQTLSSTFGSFTTPTLVRDIERLFDNTRYQTESILGDLLRNTPFSAAINKPALNAFGEPVTMPSNRFISVASDDPAWRFIVDNQLRLPVPGKYSQVSDGEGGKRRITPDEYYRFLRESGTRLKTAVIDNMADWRTLDHDEAQKRLNAEAQRIREDVKGELFQ